jgi:hypothetical protein
VVTEAAELKAGAKVADAAAGAIVVVCEMDRIVLAPSPPVPGMAGMLGMGIVIEMAEGDTTVFAALAPAAAAAASAGVSWTVVLVTTRVVSFMEVAGSRFS